MEATHSLYALIGTFGTQEMLLIALVALLIFGGKKIPEIAKGLGEGIRNFKDSLKGDDSDGKKQ
jgi:sec-independent protein translocase protein TatA